MPCGLVAGSSRPYRLQMRWEMVLVSDSASFKFLIDGAKGRQRFLRGARWLGAGVCLLALSACHTSLPSNVGAQESFDSAATFSRSYDAAPAKTCEAARRALLSQGYIAKAGTAELIEGRKSFQPNAEVNLEMTIRVVCVPQTSDGEVSIGFVTALQDRYIVKKSANSASLGVGALGSVSLPVSSYSDSLVKVGSETIATRGFYDSFFDLIDSYLDSSKDAP